MPRLGVAWGNSPDISGSTQSLGAALAGAMNGGGGAAQSKAARDAAYIESLNHHNAVYDQQVAASQAKTALEQQELAQKQQLELQQRDRAQGAAGSAWQAEDARIKPAGVGVLAPSDPAIVQYDANSKAIRDRMSYIYGNGDGNPEQRAGAVNQATGGNMIQTGNQNDFVRGNALNGKIIGEKDLLPSVGGREPIPVAVPGAPKAEKFSDSQRKAAGYANRLEAADKVISRPGIENSDLGWTGRYNRAVSAIPGIGRSMTTNDYATLTDAEKDFVTAVLRPQSGATIQPSEFVTEAEKYFPRPGDGPEQLRLKAERRKQELENLKIEAGGAGEAAATGEVTTGPDAASLQAEAQAAIAAGADPKAVAARLKKLTGGQ